MREREREREQRASGADDDDITQGSHTQKKGQVGVLGFRVENKKTKLYYFPSIYFFILSVFSQL